MKITTKIIDFIKYILYICKVYLIKVNIDLLKCASNGATLMNTHLPPYRKTWGGFFYKLYSGCTSLHLSKALQNNTASINNTSTENHSGTVHPTTRTSETRRQKVVSEDNIIRLLLY